jgi:lysophospholipase L1-like esterase
MVPIVLVGISIATALAIAEAIARLAWRLPAPGDSAAVRRTDGLPLIRTIAALMQPNTHGVMLNGTYYRTNSLGVRGPEYALWPPPGVFRICIVGDSVTMGVLVEEEDAYPARLEAALNARPGPYRYEVLNVGMAGANIQQVVHRLETIGLRYDPDLIIYGWTVNDITGPGYEAFQKPQLHALSLLRRYDRFKDSPSYLLRVLWPSWVSLSELIAPDPKSYLAELRHNYFENASAIEHFVSHLDRLAEMGARRDVCVVVFIHTHLGQLNVFHPLRPLYDHVADTARSRGLLVVPSFRVFRGQNEWALRISNWDSHPNPEGHRLLARALLEGLDALPEKCFRVRGDGADEVGLEHER